MKPNRVAIAVLVILLIPVLPQAILPANGHTAHGKAAQQYADPRDNVGTTISQPKKSVRAVRYKRKARQLREIMPAVYSNLGYAYFSENHLVEAMVLFQRAVNPPPAVFDHSSRTGS